MDLRRTFRINPALGAAALFVALAAGSMGVSSVFTRAQGAQLPSGCDDANAIVGTPGDDKLKGTKFDDVIFGGGGNDVIKGKGGDDLICARGGDDFVKGGNGDDTILGGGGDDELRGGPGNDTIVGGSGTDTANGGVDTDDCDAESETNCEEPETPSPSPAPSSSPSATPSPTATPTPTATASPTPEPTKPPNNVPPTAANDSFTTDEDQTRNVAAPGVLANDSDPEGEILHAAVVTGPSNGTLTLASNGGFAYVPASDFNGTDSFTYSAADSSSTSAPATVTITVAAVPDAPVAVAQSVSTDEDSPLTLTFLATDPDGPSPATFKITALPSNGDLRNGSGLGGQLIGPADLPYTLSGNTATYVPDGDFNGTDGLEFKAHDGAQDSAAAPASITVRSVNDAPTNLSLSSSSVDEEQPPGATVGTFSADDVDAGDSHTFSLMSGAGDTDNSKFSIVNGVLKTAAVLDYEAGSPLSIRVKAVDEGALAFSKQLSIVLNDLNDPVTVDAKTFSLPENSANGTSVGTATVTDQDPGQTHTFSITGGNSSGAFDIAPSTGAITVADAGDLDFESTPQFVLTVKAVDSGTPSSEDTGPVTIDLTNVNETPTDLALSGASVAENEPTGTSVGSLSTTDPDAGDTHSYALVSGAGDGDNGKFSIDNGVLKTGGSFDFETQGPFSVLIRTTDAGSLQREEIFSIDVTNVNDAPVMNASTFAVDENSANGTVVGTPTSSDEDAGQGHTYAITGGNTGGAFEINQTTWDLEVADTSDIDFETNPTFALTIEVTDDGNPAKDDSDTITVNLNNVNEAPVVNAATLSLPENSANGTSVGTATSSDPDAGQTRTYAITAGNTGGAFQINSSTGEITVADVADVDFESNPSFSLTVEATDNGSPPLTGSNTITVNLTNVNEAPTAISLDDNSVAENASLDTVVGTISGTDPDAGDSAGLVFSLVSGTGDVDNARFNVGPANALRTSEVFDKETQGPFSIRLRATDGGTLQFEDDFSITIDDVNEAPTVSAATFTIDENSANGTSVGTVTSSDPDAGQTRTYAITGGNTGGAFQIDPSTGAITVADENDVDHETNDPFALTVQATDDGAPQLSGSNTITVNLNDVNDNPVVNAATLSVAENSPNGTSVGFATGSDEDSPAQTLTWAITGGNTGGAFQINTSTGEITVADTSDLDFEATPSFSLTVQATDDGPGTLSGSNTVTVDLTNVNEKAAITAPSTISAQYGVTKELSGISVDDPDSGGNDITMTLGVLDGTMSLDDTVANGLVAGDVTGNGTDTVVLTGTQTEINNTLGAANGLTYTSDGGFSGLTDTLALATNDGGHTGSGGAQADTANVTIQFNAPPAATAQTVTTDEDTEKTITLAGTDADADPLTFKVTSLPASGKLHEGNSSAGTEITAGALPFTLTGDKVTYVPPLNQNGLALETFDFKANDGTVDSAAATVTLDVTAVDDLPVAVNDPVTVLEDANTTTIDVLANDTDVDGGTKTIASKTDPANGTVAITNGGDDLTYKPNADYCNNPPTVPVDTFTYTLNGGSVGTVNVTVTCVDDLPVGVNDTKTMDEDSTSTAATTIGVLGNDTDVDGGPISIQSTSDPANGTVAVTNSGGDLTYKPDANYCNDPPGTAPDTFTYTLNGGSTATVSVTVTCIDDAPVAVADAATVLEDASATTIDVRTNDTDVDDGPMVVNAKSNSTNGGTVTITNAGADLTYAPAANYCNDRETQPSGATASETFTYTLNGGSVGTVTMTVTCVNDPPTADTETFNGTDSALSNFRLDNGTSTAGLDITPATLHNVLAGDTDPEGDNVTLIAGARCTGTGPFTCLTDGYDPDGAGGPHPVERGTVHLEADGDFHYTPPPGHVGSDSFDYRVSDGQAQNSEANGTVNINVAGPTTWFVDDTAVSGGNGTSTAPFQTFGPLTTSGGSNHLDDANDHIFVYEGTYTAGVVLENGQKLLGHPHSLDITDTAGRTHTDLVSGAGTAPAISHASNTVVTLGSGNELQDLALGNGTIALAGTSVGTATVKDSSINTTGKALDVNGGNLDMTFTNVSSTGSGSEAIKLNNATGTFTAPAGTLQNATNAVVDINDGIQDFTYGGNISDNSGKVVSITATDGGTKDFNGTISGSSGGSDARINLVNNAGSIIRFVNDLTLNTGGQPAFNATGGGTIHVTSDDNVLTTTTGTPLNVVNTAIGAGDLIFDSISSNGAQNGIVLDNTGNTGNLQVTGNPGADTNEGGTIAGTTGADATTNACTKPSGQPAGVGILLKNTNGVILNDMLINGSSNHGLLAHDVNGFTLDDSTFSGTHGTTDLQDEGTATFCNLTGSATISDSVIGGGFEDSLKLRNSGGTLNRLTVTNTDFATSTGAKSDDAFEASSTGSGTMNVTVNGGSAFTTAAGDHLQYSVAGTGTGDLVVQNNTFSNNHPAPLGAGITVNPGGNGSNVNVTYNVSNNTLRDSEVPAIGVTTGGDGAAGTTGTFNGTIANNQIGVSGVNGSGAKDSASGISLLHMGNGMHTVSITGNTVRQYTSAGIRVIANTGNPTLRATVKGNSVTEPFGVDVFAGIAIEAGNQFATATVCLDLGGLLAADKNSASTGDPGNAADILLFPDGASTMNLPGYAGPANGAAADTALGTFVGPRNDGDGIPAMLFNTPATVTYTGTGTNCL